MKALLIVLSLFFVHGLFADTDSKNEDKKSPTDLKKLSDMVTELAQKSITTCKESTTDKTPFYISDEYRQGDKIWENFRSIEDHTKKVSYIPRGSIVHAPVELAEASYHPNYRVPVEVLSLPDKKWEDDLLEESGKRGNRHFRHKALTPKGLPRSQIGDQGFLDRRALIPAGKFTFFVKQGSRLEKTPGGLDLTDFPLVLVKDGDQFAGERCCEYELNEEPACYFKYRFAALNESFDPVEYFDLDPLRCGLLEDIMPVPKRSDFDVSVSRILSKMKEEYPGFGILEGVSTENKKLSGLHFLPEYKGSNLNTIHRPYMVKIPLDHETGEGPFNSYHYKPDNIASNDSFLRPKPLCAFMEVMKQFQKECGGGPGCQVQFGNFYHDPDWNVHESHGNGTCVDIRPFRDSSDADARITRSSGQYNRERTRKFINLLKRAGAWPIFFNDSKIKGSRWLSNHDDHIHACFHHSNKYVKDACNDGL